MPSSDELLHKIVTGYCETTNPLNFEESECGVCGELCNKKALSSMSEHTEINWSILGNSKAARKEQ